MTKPKPAGRPPRTHVAKTPEQQAPLVEGLVEQLGDAPTEGKVLTDAGVAAVEYMAANGRTAVSIAKTLGMHHTTFARVVERQDDVAEALQRGRAALTEELHDLLMVAARRGNVTAQIWLQKSRCGLNEAGPRDGGTKVNIAITLPEPKSKEEYLRNITAIAQGAV